MTAEVTENDAIEYIT